MGEIVQIHVGQTGVQIANVCWELYCLEHGVNPDGTLCGRCSCDDTFKNFFFPKNTGKVVARAVLVDSEPTCIDRIRAGPYGDLYSPECLISGKEDSGCLYPRGYSTIGEELIGVTMESIRMVAESCCNLRGFLIYRSVGGGTGSGLGNLIAEHLTDDYERISKMEYIIFPSPSISPLTVEPYNAMLATHLSMDLMNCSFILDNEALYDICATKLNICNPKYKNLNRIVAQVATTFTTAQRFGCHSGISFGEYQTNLVPYPRIHYPLVSYAPFIPNTGKACTRVTTEEITKACFEPSNQLVRCSPTEGKYMSCLLLYRGNLTASCINASISQLKSGGTVRFVDWQPTEFKVGLNGLPPFMVPCGGLGNSDKALLTLSSNTAIQNAWYRLVDKFNSLYSIRAYFHHYAAEGMEEDSFTEALEDITALISDYKEVEMSTNSCGQCGGNMDTCGCGKKSVVQEETQEIQATVRNSPIKQISSKPERNDEYGTFVACKQCGGNRDTCGCSKKAVFNTCAQCGGDRDTCGCSKRAATTTQYEGMKRTANVFNTCAQCGGDRDTCGCSKRAATTTQYEGMKRTANVFNTCAQCVGDRDTCGCSKRAATTTQYEGMKRTANVFNTCAQCGGDRDTCGCSKRAATTTQYEGMKRTANVFNTCAQCGGDRDTCGCSKRAATTTQYEGMKRTANVFNTCAQCGGDRDTCGCSKRAATTTQYEGMKRTANVVFEQCGGNRDTCESTKKHASNVCEQNGGYRDTCECRKKAAYHTCAKCEGTQGIQVTQGNDQINQISIQPERNEECSTFVACAQCGGNRNTCACSKMAGFNKSAHCGGYRDTCGCTKKHAYIASEQCGGYRDICGCRKRPTLTACAECGGNSDTCECMESTAIVACEQCGGNKNTCGCTADQEKLISNTPLISEEGCTSGACSRRSTKMNKNESTPSGSSFCGKCGKQHAPSVVKRKEKLPEIDACDCTPKLALPEEPYNIPIAPVQQFNYFIDPFSSNTMIAAPCPCGFVDEYPIVDDMCYVPEQMPPYHYPFLNGYHVMDDRCCACNPGPPCGCQIVDECCVCHKRSKKDRKANKSCKTDSGSGSDFEIVHDRPHLAVPIRAVKSSQIVDECGVSHKRSKKDHTANKSCKTDSGSGSDFEIVHDRPHLAVPIRAVKSRQIVSKTDSGRRSEFEVVHDRPHLAVPIRAVKSSKRKSCKIVTKAT